MYGSLSSRRDEKNNVILAYYLRSTYCKSRNLKTSNIFTPVSLTPSYLPPSLLPSVPFSLLPSLHATSHLRTIQKRFNTHILAHSPSQRQRPCRLLRPRRQLGSRRLSLFERASDCRLQQGAGGGRSCRHDFRGRA